MTLEETLRAIVREELRTALAELRTFAAAPQPAASPALLTVEQVAERAGGVTATTVRAWIDSGKLTARRAGHRWVVRTEDLERFLARDDDEHGTIDVEQQLKLVTSRLQKAGGRP
jgi:excisionase family DNA binding protein